MKSFIKIVLFTLSFLIFGTVLVQARTPAEITDWYIKDFKTEITVNKDSSLYIVEYITADCGNLPNKHGIFRVLPTQIKTDQGRFKNPIKLVSITDFNGKAYKYSTIRNFDTVTWKIGDANKTVRGLNYYKITYTVENAVRFGNNNFDELYWNIMGNYWDIETDNFQATIKFPAEVTQQNSTIDYYTGTLGSKDKSLATYAWQDNNALVFNSTKTLKAKKGITVSVIFPKNIFTPYAPSFFEEYGPYLWILIPIGVFILAFSLWKKYGKDPKIKGPVAPEFEIPDKITPMQMGVVIGSGAWKDKFMTAAIIDLAVKKFILIEEKETKILFFKQKSYELKKAENFDKTNLLTKTEKVLLDSLFDGKEVVKLNELRQERFYTKVSKIKKEAAEDAQQNQWVVKSGLGLSVLFFILGVISIILGIFSGVTLMFTMGGWPLLSLLASGIIFIIFAFIMPKRTQKGTDLFYRIKGFQMYMEKAENYRQQFYEKENIFDKFLPYAIVFGMVDLWAKKMQQIYGEDFYKNYHPAWFVGAFVASGFNASSFTSQLNSITSSISSSTSSSSGAGGAGGAGGGGGGGGGGGW